jgi:nucleotide-binding universal stress UspA family protein
MQVLIATDGTQTAISAAKKALALLRHDTEILLVTVIRGYEDPMEDAGGFEGPLMTPEEAESEFKAHLAAGRNALKHSLEALDNKANVRLIPSSDDPGKGIVDAANEFHPDLIVLGRNSKGFFSRLLHGSVSDYVAHHACCPVLIVPHQ